MGKNKAEPSPFTFNGLLKAALQESRASKLRFDLRSVAWAWCAASDFESRRLLGQDYLLRTLVRNPVGRSRTREVRCGRKTIAYRFNLGDLQSLREVWFQSSYQLPFDGNPRVVVDLGANIGLTSLWFRERYDCELIVAVEPDPENVKLLLRNLESNHIKSVVLHNAVASSDGPVLFQQRAASNAGRIVGSSDPDTVDPLEVYGLAIESVLRHLPRGCHVDLLKVDIEGGEAALFLEGNLA